MRFQSPLARKRMSHGNVRSRVDGDTDSSALASRLLETLRVIQKQKSLQIRRAGLFVVTVRHKHSRHSDRQSLEPLTNPTRCREKDNEEKKSLANGLQK